MAVESVDLPAEAIPDIRRALSYGLAAMAEIERLRDLSGISEMSDEPWPEERIPVAPCNGSAAMEFSDAFLWLDNVSRQLETESDHGD